MERDRRTQALAILRERTEQDRPRDLRSAFASDEQRAARFSARFDDLMLDYSRCAVSDRIFDALIKLAEASGLAEQREAMFRGEAINRTEWRAALHVALRAPRDAGLPYPVQIAEEVSEMLDRCLAFAEALRKGEVPGATGKRFRTVINIGIGGSDLGPAMVTEALRDWHDGPDLRFVSNVDASDLTGALAGLDPETTLFLIASKTFTTIETMTNAATARAWIRDRLGEGAVRDHFAAISTAEERAAAFGIRADRTFGFWDWVGGRYSVWSAIGLPVMIAIGSEQFRRFLAGGHTLDEHFRHAALRQNLPVLLGLVGYWHRVVMNYPTRAIIPYDQRLARFPAYLQQLDMESNGKGVGVDGKMLEHPSGPVIWGEPGTNGQHAFFQLLHQGTDIVPVEFLLAARGGQPELDHHHRLLIANCLAQSQALMQGRTRQEAEEILRGQGHSAEQAAELAPHKAFPGNRPSFTLLYRQLDPFTLGRLIALYEHRVFVEATLYGVNPFDQWGVELGKEMATALLPVIEGKDPGNALDGSTAALARQILQLRS